MKLILEVYEKFTYPSRVGGARSFAKSWDTQAISLLYLQTTYVFGREGIVAKKERKRCFVRKRNTANLWILGQKNIFIEFWMFYISVAQTFDISVRTGTERSNNHVLKETTWTFLHPNATFNFRAYLFFFFF